MTPLVRVLIADDDPLFMDALEAILGIEAPDRDRRPGT